MLRLGLAVLPLALLGGCPSNGLDSAVNPTARVVASPRSGSAPLTVSLDGRSSAAAGAQLVTFLWNFGDGTEPVDASTGTHTYTAPGTYVVRLTVTDALGAAASDTSEIVVY